MRRLITDLEKAFKRRPAGPALASDACRIRFVVGTCKYPKRLDSAAISSLKILASVFGGASLCR